MQKLNKHSKLCLNYSVVNTFLSRKIDRRLGVHGISFSEFLILYHLDQALDKMMRRIDLAETIGLSASGITRLVLPMEKIGLVKKEVNKRDARVSLVKLSESGQRILKEASISMNEASQEILSKLNTKSINEMLKMLIILGGNVK